MADLPIPPLTRRDLLLAQYDTSYAYLIDRLTSLTDAEYQWEPVAGGWSVGTGLRTGRTAPGAGDNHCLATLPHRLWSAPALRLHLRHALPTARLPCTAGECRRGAGMARRFPRGVAGWAGGT